MLEVSRRTSHPHPRNHEQHTPCHGCPAHSESHWFISGWVITSWRICCAALPASCRLVTVSLETGMLFCCRRAAVSGPLLLLQWDCSLESRSGHDGSDVTGSRVLEEDPPIPGYTRHTLHQRVNMHLSTHSSAGSLESLITKASSVCLPCEKPPVKSVLLFVSQIPEVMSDSKPKPW